MAETTKILQDEGVQSSFHEGLEPLSQKLNLDAHQAAPPELKAFFKRHSTPFVGEADELVDMANFNIPGMRSISKEQTEKAFNVLRQETNSDSSTGNFLSTGWRESSVHRSQYIPVSRRQAYTFKQIPGLTLMPALLPGDIQLRLLNRLLHRDLSNPSHKTNLHTHYHIDYPSTISPESISTSFFSPSLTTHLIHPQDPTLHKPLTIKQALDRKLRWITLGGQYDWTNKLYPSSAPPEFPNDIASFIHHLFPDMEPQAAIVNVYSPGDKLNMHRDVSEEIDEGLVSISLGCSCIFVIGLEDPLTKKVEKLAMRLNSGDVVYMKKEARLAWHGVARIEKETCPMFLKSWPGRSLGPYADWLKGKRINLNVRQMRERVMEESDYHGGERRHVRGENENEDGDMEWVSWRRSEGDGSSEEEEDSEENVVI